MIPEFWTTRDEAFLASILGESVELPVPQTRLELFLAKIAGVNVETPEPQTRAEIYLAAILGANVALPVPVSRVDFYLAKVAGLDVEIPEPLTRIDEYLAEWAENGSGEIVTVTGTSPLVLANAMAHAIRKLVQYGKCSTSGGDIYCNNGKLVAVDDELPAGYERQIGFELAAATYYRIPGFHLRGSDTVRISFSVDKACNVFGCYTDTAATDNYSMYASTSSGAKYLRYDGDTYNSYIPSSRFGDRLDVVITPTGTTGMPTDSVMTPATFESVADLCIGTTSQSASSSKLDGNIWGDFVVDGRLKLVPCKRLSDDALGYYDPDSDTFYEPIGSAPVSLGVDTSHLTVLSVVGTPEVLTIGTQTATVQNLFEVNGTADEQDIISGVITRKVGVSVSAGVITLSALDTPVTEHTTPQPLSTVEGDNTVSWTAEVSGTVKEVEYAYEAPSFEWKTASGAVVSVNDALAGEVGALTVGINPVQTGSGDPSPSNVRPISGWTQIDVWVQPTYDTSANPSATIPLGGTYYGGTLDVLTGVLTVTMGYVDLGTLSWAAYRTFFYASVSDKKSGGPGNSKDNIVCDQYPTITYNQCYNGGATGIAGYVYNRRLSIIDPALEGKTTAEVKAALSGVYAAYEIEPYQTVQLTPAQVSTLLGTNNVWASGNGEVSVTYRAEASE